MQVSKKKILLLNTSFYPNTGGVENSLRSISEELPEGSVEIIAGNRASDGGALKDEEFLFGARVVRYNVNHVFGYYYSCYKKIKNLNKEGRYSAVISRSHITTVCALLAGIKNVSYIAPSVYAYLNHPRNYSKNSIKTYIKYLFNVLVEQVALRKAGKCYVFSESMSTQVNLVSGRRDVIKCFPGVDKKRFASCNKLEKTNRRKNFGFSEKDKIILCVGRLVKIKGFCDALRALCFLPSEYKMVFVGEGPEEKNLVEKSKSMNLDERVFFFGASENPEMFYKLSDVFLFTSTFEAFGQVLLEATSASLPVVAYRNSAIQEINTATDQVYEGFEGLVAWCQEKTHESLAGSIRSCFEEDFVDEKFFKQREMFLKKYSWSTLIEEIVHGN